MDEIEIDEFSTGIRPQISGDGSWVSLGFTGQYMNATIDPIPYAIQRSIANKEFAIAEGAASDLPAVIGRVISGNEGDWSVVAVVTRGQDEKGRSASFYRYFLAEGKDALWKILAWIDAEKIKNQKNNQQKNGGYPAFNPSETKLLDQPNSFRVSESSKPQGELPTEGISLPILIPPNERYALQEINTLAIANARERPVSWALNAEALEIPWNFIAIQAASDRAYQLFQRAIANTPQVQAPPVADEQALKSAIKGLCGSSQIKPEAIAVISEALGNKQITSEYWHTLFNGQGANNALSQGIYSPQMARLLTLRAIVIPNTLPDYLNWLKITENFNPRKENSTLSSALEFQANLQPFFSEYPQLNEQLTQGLKIISQSQLSASLWEKIGDYIGQHLSGNNLAQFYYRLAAYWEQKIKNIVPENLFVKAFPDIHSYEHKLWDTEIYQSKPVQGDSDIVPLQYVIMFVLSSLLLGGFGGFFLSEWLHSSQSSTNGTETNPSPTSSSPSQKIPSSNNTGANSTLNNIPDQKLPEAVKKFNQTSQVIQKILADLDKDTGLDLSKLSSQEREKKLKEGLNNVLRDSQLSYDVITGKISNSEEFNAARRDWINAIYSYQKQRTSTKSPDNTKLDAVGYLENNGPTRKALTKDLKEFLKSPKMPSSPPPG